MPVGSTGTFGSLGANWESTEILLKFLLKTMKDINVAKHKLVKFLSISFLLSF